jgi:hypothetical protein
VQEFPDFARLSDAELRNLIHELQAEEHRISFERRILHGKITLVERELEAREWGRQLESSG